MIGSASRTAFCVIVSCLQGNGYAVLRHNSTSTLAAASLAGRAIGPAIATAANSIAVRAVSCMVMVVSSRLDWVWKVCLANSLSY